jgi:site-specific DNA-methyltransferase (adenine-specific)
MKPDYQADGVSLYLADCLDVLPQLERGTVDAIVADPPYSSGGQFAGDRLRSTKSKYQQTGQRKQWADFTGDTRDQLSHAYWCRLWLARCLELAKPGAVAAVFSDWRQVSATTLALQSGGWIYRGLAVWDKTEQVRPYLGRFRAQAEYAIWGTNGPRPKMPDVGALPGVMRASQRHSEKFHLAGKPVEVLENLVKVAPAGGLVADPFMGSGTGAIACLRTGRRYVGCEVDRVHFDIAVERIESELRGRRSQRRAA